VILKCAVIAGGRTTLNHQIDAPGVRKRTGISNHPNPKNLRNLKPLKESLKNQNPK